MKLLYKFCRKGDGKANQDICDHISNFAWVMDGATDVFMKNIFGKFDDVSWYMELLNNQLILECKQGNMVEPKEILESAVKNIYSTLCQMVDFNSIPNYCLPIFAVAFISVIDNELKYYVLGDCTISYMHDGCFSSLRDIRINSFSQENRRKIKEYLGRTGNSEIPLSIYQEIRKKANADDGYPIAMIDRTGLDQGLTGTIQLTCKDRILMFSDGCLDYLNAYPERMSHFFDIETLEQEKTNMYSYLNDKEQYYKSPRPKKTDDCSILLLEV